MSSTSRGSWTSRPNECAYLRLVGHKQRQKLRIRGHFSGFHVSRSLSLHFAFARVDLRHGQEIRQKTDPISFFVEPHSAPSCVRALREFSVKMRGVLTCGRLTLQGMTPTHSETMQTFRRYRNLAMPSKYPSHVSRRHFLAATGAAVAAAGAAWTAKSYAKISGSNDRIRVGFIGAGGMANNHFEAYLAYKNSNNVEALAVADCWRSRAEEGAQKIGVVNAFVDYRKVLDLKDVDYVTIATPEHQHATMTLAALDAGKAVYCEKPMTHTIAESHAVVKKQAEKKLPVQIGIQGMSDDSYSSAGDAIRGGVIGTGCAGTDRIRPAIWRARPVLQGRLERRLAQAARSRLAGLARSGAKDSLEPAPLL